MFRCPICGRSYETISTLKNCIVKHEEAEKVSKAREEQARVEELKTKINKAVKDLEVLIADFNKVSKEKCSFNVAFSSTDKVSTGDGDPWKRGCETFESSLEKWLRGLLDE